MRQILTLLILFSFTTILSAQNTVAIKGSITNTSNEPLAGVTVSVKGQAKTVVSAADGTYGITAPAEGVLVFTHIGYTTIEENIAGRAQINVALAPADKSLDDVVVIGYGTTKRKDLTGAVSSVKGEELAKVPVQNVAQALQGRLSGVQVTMSDGTPGQDPSIKIRGGTSITQSNQPLYVVDGVPQLEGLAFLDPMDIESIDVLKDASATAIYGARGANGVIMVTTKQTKPGKIAVNYDGYVGVKKITDEIAVLNPYQYALLTYESMQRDATRAAAFQKVFGSYDSLQINYGNVPGKNWQKEVFGNTVWNQYHKVGFSGGSKETKFNAFFSRNNDEGIMLNSASVKNIAKLNVTHNISKKIKVNAIINYSNQKVTGSGGTQIGGGAGGRLSFLQTLLRYRPINGYQGSDAALIDYDLDPLDDPNNPGSQSPIITVNNRFREKVIKLLNTNISLQYNLTKNITYNGLVNYIDKSTKNKAFDGSKSLSAIRAGGPNGSISQDVGSQFNYSNTLTYNNTFATQHKLDVTAGQEYIRSYMEGFGAGSRAFPFVNNGWDNLGLGTIYDPPSSIAEEEKLLSFFGRANYAFKGKYLLSASVRADGSSKFVGDNKWGYFPSVAASWHIVDENFMKSLSAVSDLRLRISYGQAGNNRIANNLASGIFATGIYPLNQKVVISAYPNNLANPGLKWEAVESRNLGLDIGLFNQRVTLTTELYDNRSKNLLLSSRIPSSSGFTTQVQNIGTTSSRGVEFTLNTVNIKNEDFTWNTNFNIAFNRTKVLSLTQGEKSLLSSSWNTDQGLTDYILEVGRPVGIMYGYIFDGLYQVNDFNYDATANTYTLKDGVVKEVFNVKPGFAKLKDISGPNGVPDGLIDANDRTYIGDANPKYTGGINNTFGYKGIDLSVFLNFCVGNDIYNANHAANYGRPNDFQNSFADMQNRWMTIDDKGQLITDPATLAAVNVGKTHPSLDANAGRFHNMFIEDGSFLRINNISLGYKLPKSWINKVKLSNARIYFTAYNLHVFTRYSGYDPEVSVINNAITPGVDFSAYPRGRSFVMGLNLSL